MRLRLVTSNLGGVKDRWFEERRALVVERLARLDADVLALQEATLDTRGGFYHQARDLQEALGLASHAFAPYGNTIEVMSPVHGGVAVVSRWPIVGVRNRRLPGHDQPPDARVALFVTLDAPGGAVDVVTTHLSWRPEDAQLRLMQAGLLLGELDKARLTAHGARAVLAGDLNATDDEPCIELASESLQDAWRTLHPRDPGHTWIAANPLTHHWPMPDRRLDYVFCPRGVTVRRAALALDEAEPGYGSDHLAVLVELEWE